MTSRRAGPDLLVGTAGWSLPPRDQPSFPGEGSHLERYARVFRAVEINSTFHRPHRPTTFERWAASVPKDFRFSVKVPRTITHDARLSGTRALVDEFLEQLAPLGRRLACLLVQLPPKLECQARTARAFFDHLRDAYAGAIALEPRHESWFVPAADRMLVKFRVARVAADPPRAANGFDPGGWAGMAYYRLHGSPRMYYSSYEDGFLDTLAARLDELQRAHIPCWCIFDNTTLGAGTGNALSLVARLRRSPASA
ncbi:MAG TPA: DUF72 domain-containing protein [Usitatibacter sp.]|nr:DUF72 domain-containing protein [Usitatibacter sp.]